MKQHRSTSLKQFVAHCPAALGFYEQGLEPDRDKYAVGIAAHAVLQALHQITFARGAELDEDEIRAVADATVHTLSTEGRSFDGKHEAPLPYDSCIEGRSIALGHYLWMGEQTGIRAEVGLGMTIDGEACAYDDPACRYKAILDGQQLSEVEDEEGASYKSLRLIEYKTAWSTDASELDTTQTRGQAVLAWLHNPDVDVIERSVTNLRIGATWRDEIQVFTDQWRLERWRKDILDLCTVADETREARPGVGCLGCDYSPWCPAGIEYAGSLDIGPMDAHDQVRLEELATRYCFVEGLRAELAALLRPATSEDTLPVPGGKVGYSVKPSMVPKDDIVDLLIPAWFGVSDETAMVPVNEVRGLIKAFKPSKSAIESVWKVLLPERADAQARHEAIEDMLQSKPRRGFGVWPNEV